MRVAVHVAVRVAVRVAVCSANAYPINRTVGTKRWQADTFKSQLAIESARYKNYRADPEKFSLNLILNLLDLANSIDTFNSLLYPLDTKIIELTLRSFESTCY